MIQVPCLHYTLSFNDQFCYRKICKKDILHVLKNIASLMIIISLFREFTSYPLAFY